MTIPNTIPFFMIVGSGLVEIYYVQQCTNNMSLNKES